MVTDNGFFPSDPKKIKDTIRRYERVLKAPHYDDGAGKRFLIGPLYLLMADVPGALQFYEWYEKKFPDDSVEAFNHLCWVLTLLRSGKQDLAKVRLHELIFDNLYVIPVLLGENPKQHAFQHGSNWRELSFITEGPRDEIFSLVSVSELSWIRGEWENPLLVSDVSRFVELYNVLDETNGYAERGNILNQVRLIARGEVNSLAGEDIKNVIPFKKS